MLSALLFAGALHVDLAQLAKSRWQIGLLAVGGTIAAAVVVGSGLYCALPAHMAGRGGAA